jgi:hypothetical protein
MNPGNGKVHRDCAVRCLSGGIPSVFATNDFNGSPAVLLLTGPNQKRLPRGAFLDRVAQPIQIHGRVMQIGNTFNAEVGSVLGKIFLLLIAFTFAIFSASHPRAFGLTTNI